MRKRVRSKENIRRIGSVWRRCNSGGISDGVRLGSEVEGVVMRVVAFRVRRILSYFSKAGADEW